MVRTTSLPHSIEPTHIGIWKESETMQELSGAYGLFLTQMRKTPHPHIDSRRRISGDIVDHIGYATFSGEISSTQIEFVKRYQQIKNAPDEIEYDGKRYSMEGVYRGSCHPVDAPEVRGCFIIEDAPNGLIKAESAVAWQLAELEERKLLHQEHPERIIA